MKDRTDTREEGLTAANVGGVAADRLRSFVERIERLSEEKDALLADIREVYSEAKAFGFNAKTLRRVVRERRMKANDRNEQLELFDLYWRALD
tara:strand:+ start:381 stop:659 length:279 start_codon:yes stop_codon:yes gene_type:complete